MENEKDTHTNAVGKKENARNTMSKLMDTAELFQKICGILKD